MPKPQYYTQNITQTIALNKNLNAKSQSNIDSAEPNENIWALQSAISDFGAMSLNNSMSEKSPVQVQTNGKLDKKDSTFAPPPGSPPPGAPPGYSKPNGFPADKKSTSADTSVATNNSLQVSTSSAGAPIEKRKSFLKRLMSSGPNPTTNSSGASLTKSTSKSQRTLIELADTIVTEESGRWPDAMTRNIAMAYQEHVGMAHKIATLRMKQPIQYLHLLRAGYFEPIPIAWATLNSNPLKFSIEAASGWRGITPQWRGYEDTAEERLYWVLNHREGRRCSYSLKARSNL